MSKTYYGRNGHDVFVVEDGEELGGPLPPRLDLVNHSPDGFAWGYGGSGPAQLALAMLADHYELLENGDQLALSKYQVFKWQVIARLPERWELTTSEIANALNESDEVTP